MITPTARSMTLPRAIKALNSLSIRSVSLLMQSHRQVIVFISCIFDAIIQLRIANYRLFPRRL